MSLVADISRRLAARMIRAEPTTVSEAVAGFRSSTDRRMPRGRPPRGVASRRVEARGVVPPGLWLGVPAPSRSILYLHGGAYVAGRPEIYTSMVGALCKALQAEAFLADYRKGPEFPYPAAVDDAVAAYRMMLDRGVNPANLAVMGDSAGGGLTLATIQRLRDEGTALPAAVVALSPWADLTCGSESHRRFDGVDPMLSTRQLELAASAYLGEVDPAVAGASPVFGDFAGLPPMMLAAANDEVLLDDTLTAAERARSAGVPVEVIRRDGVLHVWPLMFQLMPEAKADFAEMIEFLRLRVMPAN
jgi:acetyl esterase/lipase